MSKHIYQVIKDQVLMDIKNGAKVTDTAVKYGVSDKTIYKWLGSEADNTGTSHMEVARLMRENRDLKEIIGFLTLEKKRVEKNKGRS